MESDFVAEGFELADGPCVCVLGADAGGESNPGPGSQKLAPWWDSRCQSLLTESRDKGITGPEGSADFEALREQQRSPDQPPGGDRHGGQRLRAEPLHACHIPTLTAADLGWAIVRVRRDRRLHVAPEPAGEQVRGRTSPSTPPGGHARQSEGAAAAGPWREAGSRPADEPGASTRGSIGAQRASGHRLWRQRQVTPTRAWRQIVSAYRPGGGGRLVGRRSVCQAARSGTGSQNQPEQRSQGPRHHTVTGCRVVPPS